MLRRAAALGILALALAACVPVLQPSITAGTVTLTPTVSVYAVTLHVLDATTDDTRCTALGPDVACIIGDIPAGDTAVVVVTGSATACSAFGFTNPNQNVRSYRPFPCSRSTP